MIYSTSEIERIARVAFIRHRNGRNPAAGGNRKSPALIKANVLENGVLWREVVSDVGKEYSDVTLEHMAVTMGQCN